MKANDLMIRSWVMLGEKKKLRCYGANTHTNDVFLENGVVTNVSELTPIPLTTEILEKNGFVKDKSVGYCERYIWADSTRLPHAVVELSFGDDGATMLNCWTKLNDGENNIHICDPNYVHELQQALRLCGIKKEIEL